MKNIIVTGGAGYIGSHLIELLIKKNLILSLINIELNKRVISGYVAN